MRLSDDNQGIGNDTLVASAMEYNAFMACYLSFYIAVDGRKCR